MDICQAFQVAFLRKQQKNWQKIYVLVDIHDTIFKACYQQEEQFRFFPHAKYVLQKLSQRDDVCLILWSSAYSQALNTYSDFFNKNGIQFNYLNKNPEVVNTSFQDFTDKLYFNVGIDDKFGFQPQTDWKILKEYLKTI